MSARPNPLVNSPHPVSKTARPTLKTIATHTGFAEAAAAESGMRFEVMTEVTSDEPAAMVEAAIRARMTQGRPPDGLVTGSTTTAMAAISGAEAAGLVIGRDFDIVAKEAIQFLHRFRRESLVAHEDVSRAGAFPAYAVVAAIDHPQLRRIRGWTARQALKIVTV